MEYKKFENIFNKIIFNESKKVLLMKIAKNPNRYVGLFRPTKPHAKILQNLLQSHEIRFGDAFEKIIEEYLKEYNYELLNKKFVTTGGDKLTVDHHFQDNSTNYFIEQKIRDDHDSTKKRGQITNFENKLNEVINNNKDDKKIIGLFYFIDPDLKKIKIIILKN